MDRASPSAWLLLALVMVGIASLAAPTVGEAASTLRCGNRLVKDGSRVDEVFRLCGEPTFRSFSTEIMSAETVRGVLVTKAVPVETWTYNRGPRAFVRYLTFRDGYLVHVTEGNYGY